MPDQAYDLRQMTNRRERCESPRRDRPALVAVAGGKGGVGTTTVAWNLATAAATAGCRVLFLDADPQGGDAAVLCGIEERHTIADVLAGRRTWNEATQAGPHGVGLIAGQRGWPDRDGSPAVAAERLLERLSTEHLGADLVVIDAGHALGAVARRVCREADAAVLVTTSDAAAVVDTFAAMKAMPQFEHWHVVVNRAPAADAALMVHARLAKTCRRMLGIELPSAGLMAAACPSGENSTNEPIRLNLRVTTTDNVRGESAAEMLLNWRRQAEFNAQIPKTPQNS